MPGEPVIVQHGTIADTLDCWCQIVWRGTLDKDALQSVADGAQGGDILLRPFTLAVLRDPRAGRCLNRELILYRTVDGRCGVQEC